MVVVEFVMLLLEKESEQRDRNRLRQTSGHSTTRQIVFEELRSTSEDAYMAPPSLFTSRPQYFDITMSKEDLRLFHALKLRQMWLEGGMVYAVTSACMIFIAEDTLYSE